jgi:hypothetical protein
VPILIRPIGKRRKKKDTPSARLTAYAEAEQQLLAEYALPPTEPISKCPHGVMVERGTTASWYCTVCRDIRAEDAPRRKPYQVDKGHPLRLGLDRFPRTGFLQLSKAFYEDWSDGSGYEFINTPADHEQAPGDLFTPRMHASAQGGYTNDRGAAVRAARPGIGFNEDTREQLRIGFAKMLAPWEYEREDAHLFQRRLFNPVIRAELQHHTGPALVDIGASAARSHKSDVREGWKKPRIVWDDPYSFPQDAKENLRLYLRDGLSPRWTGETKPTATDKQIEEWREKHWSRGRGEWNPKLFRREPWCSCPDCTRYWKSNRSKDWRDDRNNRGTGMRDINTRLELYDHGTGRLNVERMRATCDGLLWPGHIRFILGSGVTVRQHHWPGEDRTPRGHSGIDPAAKMITRSGCVCALCSTAGMPEYRCS